MGKVNNKYNILFHYIIGTGIILKIEWKNKEDTSFYSKKYYSANTEEKILEIKKELEMKK